MKKRLYNLKEDIITFFTYPFVHLRFIYYTKIYPRKAKHHWCRFYDWKTYTEKEGWYIFDKHGYMIPYLHLDDNRIICLYPSINEITPIRK